MVGRATGEAVDGGWGNMGLLVCVWQWYLGCGNVWKRDLSCALAIGATPRRIVNTKAHCFCTLIIAE